MSLSRCHLGVLVLTNLSCRCYFCLFCYFNVFLEFYIKVLYGLLKGRLGIFFFWKFGGIVLARP